MLLQEEVFGALAYVYTGSTSAPETFIPMIINDELDPGRGAGNMYGRGLYTVYDLPDTQTEKVSMEITSISLLLISTALSVSTVM